MDVTNALSNTLGIIDAAARVLKTDSAQQAMGFAKNVYDRAGKAGQSVLAYSAQTTILSRSFVDERIIDEAIMPNYFRCLHEWYAAQIIATLHLSRMVDGKRTIQDVMAVVQTGHNAHQNNLMDSLRGRFMGQESFLTNYLGEAAVESMALVPFNKKFADAQVDKATAARIASTTTQSVKSVASSEHRIGPMGELYEVKLTSPEDGKSSITVPVFIQMQPSIVPGDIAPRFIDMNVEPSAWQRWTQMRAGELTFWKDYIFQRDLIKRQRSILKDPQAASAFTNFLKTVAKKDKFVVDEIADTKGSKQSSNLANSVVVFSEDTVAQAKADSGIDLHNERDRQRYFRDTYTMIVAIVDPMHQRVTTYFNGIDGGVDASYNEFRPKDSKFDPKDFMTALQAFSTNNVGRLR